MTKTGDLNGGFLKWALFAVSVLTAFSAKAAVQVQAVVDRNEIGVGDSFTLAVVVQSTDSSNVNDPRVPDLKGFELLNSWRSSGTAERMMATPQGMQFATQRTDEFSYLLAAKQKGTYTINAFEIVVDGKLYNTKPITIRVGEKSVANRGMPKGGRPQAPNRRAMPPGFGMPDDSFFDNLNDEDDPFSALLRQRQQLLDRENERENRPEPEVRTLPGNANEAFFIQVEVDKTDVYEGEQVTASWYIYTRGQMETLERQKFPDLRGFWKEIIEEVPSIQFTDEIVNGVPYKKALLATHALFPIKAGTAIVDEFKIKSRVRMPTEGFGGFSFGRAYEYVKSSKSVKINVKPLPTEGRPKDFSGAVGQFDIHGSVENQTVMAHQPFSFKLRFEGSGNAKLIELPAIEWPPGLEVYDTKSDAKFFKNGKSYKEFEILLIPRQEGVVKIPAISFGMFDPQSKKYVSRATNEITLQVTANPNGAQAGSKPEAGGVAPHPGAAAPVVTGNVLPGLVFSWENPSPIAMASSPKVLGGLYGFVLLMLIWKSKVELGWGRRRQSLRDIVHRRYKKLETPLQKNDYRRVGAEMTNIFNLVLGAVSEQEGAGLDLEKMLERISPSLRREHGEALRKQYEVFQIMSFAPENILGPYKESARVRQEVDSAKALLQKVINSSPEKSEA